MQQQRRACFVSRYAINVFPLYFWVVWVGCCVDVRGGLWRSSWILLMELYLYTIYTCRYRYSRETTLPIHVAYGICICDAYAMRGGCFARFTYIKREKHIARAYTKLKTPHRKDISM